MFDLALLETSCSAVESVFESAELKSTVLNRKGGESAMGVGELLSCWAWIELQSKRSATAAGMSDFNVSPFSENEFTKGW